MPGSGRAVQSTSVSNRAGAPGPPHLGSNVTSQGSLGPQSISWLPRKLPGCWSGAASTERRNTTNPLWAASSRSGTEVRPSAKVKSFSSRVVPVTASHHSGCRPATAAWPSPGAALPLQIGHEIHVTRGAVAMDRPDRVGPVARRLEIPVAARRFAPFQRRLAPLHVAATPCPAPTTSGSGQNGRPIAPSRSPACTARPTAAGRSGACSRAARHRRRPHRRSASATPDAHSSARSSGRRERLGRDQAAPGRPRRHRSTNTGCRRRRASRTPAT